MVDWDDPWGLHTQFRFWRDDVGTKLEKSSFWTTAAIVGSSSPVWNA